jgi:hypothetical protein
MTLGSRTLFRIIGLDDRAAPIGPKLIQRSDNGLKIHGRYLDTGQCEVLYWQRNTRIEKTFPCLKGWNVGQWLRFLHTSACLIMELYDRIEQILENLRPAFSRRAAFDWFVLLLWATLLTAQAPAITTYVNALGLSECYYHQALHWFRSEAFSIDKLCYLWSDWLATHPNTKRLKGQLVYVGDGLKVSKEGLKMPGVKRLHQESANVSKPEWIRGHYFSALGLLIGRAEALFAAPCIVKLHDGVEAVHEEGTLVEKMAAIAVGCVVAGSYILLDAYYAASPVLKIFRGNMLHLITRVRSNTVAHAPPYCG